MSIKINCNEVGTIIVHELDKVPEIIDCLLRFKVECHIFHKMLMNQNVKAYRCNDGWVDRENHNITFFSSERQYGYYWGNLDLKKGDKIFIGNAHDNGKFAIIENTVMQGNHSATYHYKLIEDPIKKKKKWSIKNIFKLKRFLNKL